MVITTYTNYLLRSDVWYLQCQP